MKPTEFQKITTTDETRYVLESASVGGTSSGSVASVTTPLGKVRKRSDNILAQETDDDPCWKNYRQLGTKKKKGKTVPNCVPKTEDHTGFDSGWGSDSYATYAKGNHGRGVFENSSDICRVCGQTPCNCTSIYESSPPGFPEDLMMKLKKQYKGNPERAFATAWAIHKKKKKSVKEDPYFEDLKNALEAKLKPTDPVDVWKQDFQNANPEQYHQFRNKTPEKKDQMAISAYYAAKQPKTSKK